MRRTLLIELLFFTITTATIIANEQNKVCENEQCVLAGALINKIINKAVNPCEDFYSYACGNWASSFPLPNNEEVWNIDKMIDYSAKLELKEILEQEEAPDDFTPLKYEKWWYKSCMDTDRIEETGIKPLEEILEKFGGWPISMPGSDWTDENHEWQGAHEFYTEYRDLSSLFNIQVAGDRRESSKNVINLNKPSDTLLDALLKKGEETVLLQKYGEFIKNVLSVFVKSSGKTVADEDITKDVEDMIAFEKSLRLLKVSANESEDLEHTRDYMTIEKLQEFYDQETDLKPTAKINWLETISFPFKKIENVTIDNLEDIGVEDKYFLQKLSHLLSETPNRVIVNYVHWKFISSFLKYTNKEMRDLYHQLLLNPEDPVVVSERWEECKSDMRLSLGYKYEYVRRHFNEGNKKLGSDIASEMRGEMLDEIEHSKWIDDVTKEETMVRLRAMKWQSGNSHIVSNKDHLQNMYDGLIVTASYFDNELNYREFYMNRVLKRLRHTRSHHRYVRVDPLQAVTVYDKNHNILVMTTAQLSVPLLHSSLPLSVSYGFIAPTMGQQMSRTMEKEVNTNVYVTPWSSYLGDTYKTYEPITSCLTKQYYNYSVGPATLDENMYDAIGLKVAYNAFQNSFNRENDARLPELEELTDDQLFFVSFALKYCQSSSPKYQSEHDPAFETPNEYRVLGAVSNSEYFAKAFGCAPNTPMNPETKCVV